jgi:hypothetical protein
LLLGENNSEIYGLHYSQTSSERTLQWPPKVAGFRKHTIGLPFCPLVSHLLKSPAPPKLTTGSGFASEKTQTKTPAKEEAKSGVKSPNVKPGEQGRQT